MSGSDIPVPHWLEVEEHDLQEALGGIAAFVQAEREAENQRRREAEVDVPQPRKKAKRRPTSSAATRDAGPNVTSASKASRSRKDAKPPASPYHLYLSIRVPEVKANNPDVSNADIRTRLSQEWKRYMRRQKLPYEEEFRRRQQAYARDHPTATEDKADSAIESDLGIKPRKVEVQLGESLFERTFEEERNGGLPPRRKKKGRAELAFVEHDLFPTTKLNGLSFKKRGDCEDGPNPIASKAPAGDPDTIYQVDEPPVEERSFWHPISGRLQKRQQRPSGDRDENRSLQKTYSRKAIIQLKPGRAYIECRYCKSKGLTGSKVFHLERECKVKFSDQMKSSANPSAQEAIAHSDKRLPLTSMASTFLKQPLPQKPVRQQEQSSACRPISKSHKAPLHISQAKPNTGHTSKKLDDAGMDDNHKTNVPATQQRMNDYSSDPPTPPLPTRPHRIKAKASASSTAVTATGTVRDVQVAVGESPAGKIAVHADGDRVKRPFSIIGRAKEAAVQANITNFFTKKRQPGGHVQPAIEISDDSASESEARVAEHVSHGPPWHEQLACPCTPSPRSLETHLPKAAETLRTMAHQAMPLLKEVVELSDSMDDLASGKKQEDSALSEAQLSALNRMLLDEDLNDISLFETSLPSAIIKEKHLQAPDDRTMTEYNASVRKSRNTVMVPPTGLEVMRDEEMQAILSFGKLAYE